MTQSASNNKSLDWPLMKNNITREDLDTVVRFLSDEPILTQSKQVRRVRGGMVPVVRRPLQRAGQFRLVGQPNHDGAFCVKSSGPARLSCRR